MSSAVTSERGEITFGKRSINFSVIRSRRRKTVSIAVDPESGVLLTAPPSIDMEQLMVLVHKKGAWIIRNLKKHSELENIEAREFVNGESFAYLGRHLLLKIEKNKKGPVTPTCKIVGKYMLVSCSNRDGIQEVRQAILEWYKKHAEKKIPNRLQAYSLRLGIQFSHVYIKDQQKRWGSCDSKGNLRFNWKIIMAPLALLDYVIAHELCHLRVKDHSIEFWKLLRMIMPDYELRRERLRKVGVLYRL